MIERNRIIVDRYNYKEQKIGEMCVTGYNMTVTPDDGTGPEIVREVRKVLDQVGRVYGHSFNYTEILTGGRSIDAYGVPLTEEAPGTAEKSDTVLLGVMGGDVGGSRRYDVTPDLRLEVGLLATRKGLGFFASTRPAYFYKELAEICPLKKEIIGDGFDMMIIREFTGGFCFGDRYTEKVDGVMTAVDTLTYNEKEIRRTAIKAFDVAMKHRGKIINVDKANVLGSSRLWRKVAEEVAGDYPEVELSHVLVGNCVMQLAISPGQSDMILTEDTLGDILSGETSMITGSIRMLSSANMNESEFDLYESSHGSAPDMAGKDMANPIATILSAAMLPCCSFDLDWETDAIENIVQAALIGGYRTGNIVSEGRVRVDICKAGSLIAQRIRR